MSNFVISNTALREVLEQVFEETGTMHVSNPIIFAPCFCVEVGLNVLFSPLILCQPFLNFLCRQRSITEPFYRSGNCCDGERIQEVVFIHPPWYKRHGAKTLMDKLLAILLTSFLLIKDETD